MHGEREWGLGPGCRVNNRENLFISMGGLGDRKLLRARYDQCV